MGVLAVLLSLVLGASHAALPGHGKTLIAAYLAGRRGPTWDALLVGATVTVTHTAGVLVVGLLLSAFATLIGEQLLGVLGVVSGLLVAVIGLGRTWFGVLLMLGYGLGMAATLTVVGLLLVRLRDRAHRLARARENRYLTRLAAATPVLTAALVLVVGLGLVARGVTGTI